MTKLITVDRAKSEIKRLQYFVDLVESYEADTLEKLIVKEYAYTNSIAEVSKKLNVAKEYATKVIKHREADELHKIVRSVYMLKTKPSRNR